MSELSELGKEAVWYCEHNFAIIPLYEKSKVPATSHGLNDWFDDPDSARAVWGRFPNYNIGIVCGSPSRGLLVLDFDIDEEREKDGLSTLRAWEAAHGELPETAVAITGSGGMHYIYRTDRTNIHPSANAELGVDVRCDGGYIVAPPSIHPNGRRYEWQDHPEDVPIATATGPVYDFLDHVQRNGGKDETKKENGKFKMPDKIKKGERDKTLFRYASHLRAIGRSDDEILKAVMGANFLTCEPPMDSRDVQRIVRSACKYERGDHPSDDAPDVGRPGGSGGDDQKQGGGKVPNFRTPKGVIKHNLLARVIMEQNHACTIDGSLAVWMGKRWGFGSVAVKTMCTAYADDIRDATRNEVVKYLNTSPNMRHVTSDNGFDGRTYIQFVNGTWDVLAERFVEPTPDMYIIGELTIALNMDAPYGLADEFLASIANNDTQTERVLREIIGACMCSKLIVDQSPMFIGRAHGITASNGKSTYINMLRSLLGENNVSTLDVNMYGKPFYVADLVGKLANLGDDIPSGYLTGQEASTWKRAVTGDEIRADVKYGDPFEFRPTATQIFSMNVIPRIPADDDGLYRRLAFVPFRNHFEPGKPGYDPHLKEKLARRDVLERFAVLGLMDLRELIERAKFSEISDMRVELDNVRTSNDVVRRWIEWAGMTPEKLDGRWIEDVYKEFTSYATEANEKMVAQPAFTRRVLAVWPCLESTETRERGANRRGRQFKLDGSASINL